MENNGLNPAHSSPLRSQQPFETAIPKTDPFVNKDVTTAQNQYRNKVFSNLKSGKSFRTISSMIFLESQGPEIEAINNFKKNNKDFTDEVYGKGWEKLKTNWKTKNSTQGSAPSSSNELIAKKFETLRAEAVKLTWDLVFSELNKMGYENLGEVVEFGTPGWDSDIDTVFKPSKDCPDEIATTAAIMFDMVMFEKFGGTPGTLFDTEVCLSHPGISLGTEKKMLTEEGKAGLVRVEMNAKGIQELRRLGGLGSEKWEDYKNNQLDSVKDNKDLHTALTLSFDDVELLQKEIDNDINKQLEDKFHNKHEDLPNAKALAVLGYKTPILLSIGKKMDDLKKGLGSIENKLKREQELSLNEKQQHDRIHLQIANLALLRTSFFEENYTTQGAYNVVCERKGGQIDQRKIDKARKEKVDTIRGRPDFSTRWDSEIDSPTELDQERLIQENRLAVSLEVLPRSSRSMSATPLENLFSMFENQAMYVGHFNDKMTGSTGVEVAKKALVATSKYCERVLLSASILLDKIEHKNPSLQENLVFQGLKEEVTSLYTKSRNMECVKRNKILNVPTAKKQLLDIFEGSAEMNSEKKAELSELLDTKLKEIEEIKKRAKTEEGILYQVIYKKIFDSLFSELNKSYPELEIAIAEGFYGPDELPITTNDAFNKILFGFSGLPKEEYGTEELYNLAADITLDDCGIHDESEIDEFNNQLEYAIINVFKEVFKSNLVQMPSSQSDEVFSLHLLLQEAKK